MPDFTVIDAATGDVIRVGSCPESMFDLQKMHDGEYVLPGVMLDQRTQKWDVAKGVAVDLPGPSAAELTAAAWVALRAERDRRLAACDWTQIPDNPDPKKAQWAAYRQALRDLPKNTTNPANPVWPNLPA